MLKITNPVYDALSKTNGSQFARRCADFLQKQGVGSALSPEEMDGWVAKRLPEFERAGLTSERSAVLLLLLEGRLGHEILADPRVAQGLSRLPMDDAVRINWLRTHVAQRSEWSHALDRR